MEEFSELVKVKLAQKIGIDIQIKKITKNNGVVHYGLMVLEKKSNVVPMIYLEYFFQWYQSSQDIEVKCTLCQGHFF